MVSEPNFHRGGGVFSRSIAAQTEKQFLEQGYDALLSAETTAWAGVYRAMRPVPYGVARRAWWQASNLNGQSNFYR
jgi:hypothetical protein